METSFEIIFWDVPEKLCEFWDKMLGLVGDGLVGREVCLTSHDLVFRASQIEKKHVMDVWSRIFYVNLASLLGNPSFFRQLRTLLEEGFPPVPTSTAKRSTAQQFFLMVCISGSYLLNFKQCHLSIFSSHEQVSSMIMTCLCDEEYTKMLGQSTVRAIWIENTYCLLQSVASFQLPGASFEMICKAH